MQAISYTALRNHLADLLDQVNDDQPPVLITRQNGKAAVLMCLGDFQSYEATAYLRASPKNAARLNQAIAEIEANTTINHELLDP